MKFLGPIGVYRILRNLRRIYQRKLVSGTNIKTINNTSLLGSGNMTINADTSDCVKVTSQSFSDAQKGIARSNIGAAHGIYLHCEDPSAYPYLQISTFGDASAYRIDISGIYTGGSYTDLIGSLIISNYNSASGECQAYWVGCDIDDVINGIYICLDDLYYYIVIESIISIDSLDYTIYPMDGTSVEAILDTERLGSLVSTITPRILQDASQVYHSLHPVVGTSQPAGGMLPNAIYDLGTLTGSVTIAFASPTDNDIVNHYYFAFDTSITAPTITWPASITSWFGGSAPTINANKHYEVSVIDGVAITMEV